MMHIHFEPSRAGHKNKEAWTQLSFRLRRAPDPLQRVTKLVPRHDGVYVHQGTPLEVHWYEMVRKIKETHPGHSQTPNEEPSMRSNQRHLFNVIFQDAHCSLLEISEYGRPKPLPLLNVTWLAPDFLRGYLSKFQSIRSRLWVSKNPTGPRWPCFTGNPPRK